MARQYPQELHIGLKVLVHVNPTAHPVPSKVTKINHDDGTVHVNPIGFKKVQWKAVPQAISTESGLYLKYKENRFYFDTYRTLND